MRRRRSSAVASLIGTRAERSNPALAVLAPLVGRWTTNGSHPLLPGVPLHGRASFEPIHGGAFVLMRTEVDHDAIPDGAGVFGSDDDGTLHLLYFDERDVSRRYEVTATAEGLTWRREDPGFAQRNRIVVSDGRLRTVGEMSRDGGAWEPDLELTYVRAD